mmetsp:Transcript_26097/g.41388  ORF Transcript_26097/g.41388 Transcript_26097/m.41388 type:complete len:162 (-) Transcript_26097:41-526(-)
MATFIEDAEESMAYQLGGQLLSTLEGIVSTKASHPDVEKVLVELDINASLATIKALLQDLKPILAKSGSSLKICFENLNSSLSEIQQQLDAVEQKCAAHKKSWSSYMYTNPDVSAELNEIKNLKKIMDHRIDLLTKSATIELQLLSIDQSKANDADNALQK